MKLITFAIPCYNSAEYMGKCINSVLKAGNKAEIIIIDDGSKDNTGKIADEYGKEFPKIVKVIHQENGGHGEGVNQGILNATGKYFKVVDSDDWLDEHSLKLIIEKLEEFESKNIEVDALFTNYVYEHMNDEKTHSTSYKNYLPQNEFFCWDSVGKFSPSNYILMHTIIHRTDVLRKCKIMLPKHTFYVDNIFVYQSLPYIKKMYYMDVDLYRYYIGREDQSVNEKVMIKQIDQQIYITKYLVDLYDLSEIRKYNDNLGKYMLHYLSMMFAISFVFLMIDDTKESDRKIIDLKKYLKEKMPGCYRKIIYRSIAFFSNFHTKAGKKAVEKCYRILRKIYKFN